MVIWTLLLEPDPNKLPSKKQEEVMGSGDTRITILYVPSEAVHMFANEMKKLVRR